MKNIKQVLKRSFLTGLLALTPLLLTIYLAVRAINFMDNASEIFLGRLSAIPGLGFVLFILLVLFVGFFTQYYLGKRFFEFMETILSRIPFIKSIYNSIKQVSQSLYTRDKFIIKKTVLIEYPRKNFYALGFITEEISEPEIFNLDKEKRYYSVFIPTTPNPTSGFNLLLPESEVTPLKMSTEEAMKFIISLGAMNSSEKKSSKLEKEASTIPISEDNN